MSREMLRAKRVFAFALALTLILPAGCTPAPAQAEPMAERTFFAMDTVMTLRLYEGGEDALLEQAEDLVKQLEALWSATDENSEIYALNHGRSAGLSPETADLLRTALGMCERTDGALDISIYPVLCAWGFTTGEYAVPDGETVAALLAHVDYTQVLQDGTAAALPDGMEIDLGSIAKGSTGWRLAHLLKKSGVTSALLDLGGNIQTVGAKPDGSPWRIGIRDPEGGGNLGVVEAVDKAVITSGGYERYFEQDGVRYWHILDPKTGCPAHSGLISVTVVGDTNAAWGDAGAVCDALSTALFVMGREEAVSFWRTHRDEWGFELILVEEDGSVTITAGLEDKFTLSQKNRTLAIAQP